MKSRFPMFGLTALSISVVLSACNPNPIAVSTPDNSATGSSTLENVKPGRLAAAHALLDGGFENGLASWHTCSNYKPVTSNDSAAGQGSITLPEQSCVYQTVQAVDQKTYELSCQAKRSGAGWTALTLAYLDENYHTLYQEEVEVNSQSYKPASVSLNALQGAAFVEVLAYSNGAVLTLDDCTLESFAAHPGVVSNPVEDGFPPDLADLKKRQSFSFDQQDVENGDLDWREAWMAHNDLGIFIAWDTYTQVPSHTWGLGVYIDTDRNRDTGFTGFNDEFPIGVDYLVEGVEQFTYTGTGNDWSWEMTKMGGSDVQILNTDIAGDFANIDLFFKADSASIGGKSTDYYPDKVIDQDATNAARYYTYNATTAYNGEPGSPVTTTPEPPVVTPPIVVTPPVVTNPNPSPTTPIAKLDVRTNLEGHEIWNVTDAANFPSQIVTRNAGNVTLTNVTVNSSVGEGCAYTYASLEPGESKQEICRTPIGNRHYQHAIASATAPDGQEVRDDDSTTISTGTNVARNLLSVTPDNNVVNIGDTVTFYVQVASAGNRPETEVSKIDSSVQACNRSFNPSVALDSMQAYQCTVLIDQLPFNAKFEAVSAGDNTVNNVVIVEAGVPTLSHSIHAYNLSSDLFSATVYVKNIGAVDVSNLSISGQSVACNHGVIGTPVTELAVGESTSGYICKGVINERGGSADTSIVVSGTMPDGQPFETVLESTTTAFRDTQNLVLSLADKNSSVIQGAANEAVNVRFKLSNLGYFSANDISLSDFQLVSYHPEYNRPLRYNPNAVVPPDMNVESCATAASVITSQPNFVLAPGDAIEFDCSVTIPASSFYMNAILDYKTPVNSYPESSAYSGTAGYFSMLATEAVTDNLAVVGNYQAAADAAIQNPTISPSRVVQILKNPDFENVAADGMPANWAAGCTEGALSTNDYYGKAVGLRTGHCVTYVLDSNEMAQLSNHEFNLGCELTDTSRSVRRSQLYSSLTISLNGTETKTESEYAQGYLATTGIAPATVTEGYISLYTNGNMEVDNCQLILTRTASNTASIKVSNHFDGVDVYKRSNPMDFMVKVANDGNTVLQNIEVSSSQLACDKNYATLQAGEVKEFKCAGNGDALKHWDDRVSHVITATADSPSGVVADSDFSGYGNPYIIDQNGLAVTVNSQPQDAISPVAIGSDVEIRISLVQRSGGRIGKIASSIPACERRIDPAVGSGDYVSYTCTIENIQQTTNVTITPLDVGIESSEGRVLTSGPGIFTVEVAP